MNSVKLGYKWDLLNILLLFLITSFALSKPAIKFVSNSVENLSEINTLYSGELKDLFADKYSVGVLAICAAEGNCTVDGSKTSLYYYHVDPGNSVLLCIPQRLQRLPGKYLTLFKHYTTIAQMSNPKFLNLQCGRSVSNCIMPVAPLRFLVQIISAIFLSDVLGL